MATSIVTWKNELAHVEEEITQYVNMRAVLQEQVEAVEANLRNVRKNLSDLQDRRSKEEVQLTELRLRGESICDHVSRRYQIDLTAFEPDRYALLKVVTTQKEKKNVSITDETNLEQLNEMESALKFAEADEGQGVDGAQQPSVHEVLEGASTGGTQPFAGSVEFKGGFSEIPWERIEVMVAELTERVDSMGPVNIDAIQEYEELEERYTFLEQQNTDLINGKQELLEAISRINKTTRELFATTFEQVRLNFQEMFTELFGGGKANLLLVDDTDPL